MITTHQHILKEMITTSQHILKEMFFSGSWVCWLSLHARARVLPGGMPGFQSLAYWDRGSIPGLCARTSLQVREMLKTFASYHSLQSQIECHSLPL